MKKRDTRDEAEYRAKVVADNELTRGRVPSPLLKEMGARPGDYMIFHISEKGEAVMRISRSKGAPRPAKAKRKQSRKRGR
jgi:hypothetical protein